MSKGKSHHNRNKGKILTGEERLQLALSLHAGAKKEDLARPIEDLGLSENTLGALKGGRVDTVADLASRSYSQMFKIQNIGRKNCIEISNALKKFGVDFAQEEEPPNKEQRADGRNKDNTQEAVANSGGEKNKNGAEKNRNNAEKNKNGVEKNKNDGRNANADKNKGGDRAVAEPNKNVEKNQSRNKKDRNDRLDRSERADRSEKNERSDRRDRNERNDRRERSSDRQDAREDRNKNRSKGENAQLNDYLSRIYAGMSISEILMGRRRRPTVEKIERQPLTETSLVKFCRKGKWGYKDWKGNVIIPPQYDEAFGFFEERGCVEKEGKLGYIDRKNNLVIDYKYDCATSFSEGLASVTIGEKSGYIDVDGNQIIDFIYDVATPFYDGKAIVRADDRWGVLSRENLSVFWR